MNIRSKKRGKAVLWNGTNFEEILDTFNMWNWAKSRYGKEDRQELLTAYIADAQARGSATMPKPLFKIGRDDTKFAQRFPVYIVAVDDISSCLTEAEFNNYYEEDL